MLQQYHSELGETKKYNNTARFNPFISKWAVRTKEVLKGQGIKFFEIGEDGRTIYYLTQKAFDKICEKTNISQDILFD